MNLLKIHGKLEPFRRPITNSQLLFAGLLGYGILIAMPLSKYFTAVSGWGISATLLAATGYLLRTRFWRQGADSFKFFGLSLVWLLVFVGVWVLVGIGDLSEASSATLFGPILLAVVPLWLPVGVGMLFGEFRVRILHRMIQAGSGESHQEDQN